MEASANLSRVEDILAELRPQVRRLAAQAEQQASRARAGDELAAALVAVFGSRWHEAAARGRRGRDDARGGAPVGCGDARGRCRPPRTGPRPRPRRWRRTSPSRRNAGRPTSSPGPALAALRPARPRRPRPRPRRSLATGTAWRPSARQPKPSWPSDGASWPSRSRRAIQPSTADLAEVDRERLPRRARSAAHCARRRPARGGGVRSSSGGGRAGRRARCACGAGWPELDETSARRARPRRGRGRVRGGSRPRRCRRRARRSTTIRTEEDAAREPARGGARRPSRRRSARARARPRAPTAARSRQATLRGRRRGAAGTGWQRTRAAGSPRRRGGPAGAPLVADLEVDPGPAPARGGCPRRAGSELRGAAGRVRGARRRSAAWWCSATWTERAADRRPAPRWTALGPAAARHGGGLLGRRRSRGPGRSRARRSWLDGRGRRSLGDAVDLAAALPGPAGRSRRATGGARRRRRGRDARQRRTPHWSAGRSSRPPRAELAEAEVEVAALARRRAAAEERARGTRRRWMAPARRGGRRAAAGAAPRSRSARPAGRPSRPPARPAWARGPARVARGRARAARGARWRAWRPRRPPGAAAPRTSRLADGVPGRSRPGRRGRPSCGAATGGWPPRAAVRDAERRAAEARRGRAPRPRRRC